MAGPLVAIFHQHPDPGAASVAPLTNLLSVARDRLVDHQTALFRRAGACRVLIVGRDHGLAETFGERLARLVSEERPRHGLIVFGGGAVPLLRRSDAAALVETAAGTGRRSLTNNRYSSDVCAISEPEALRELPPLPSDNALPRWLEERAGFAVSELQGRVRLGLDLDGPLDLALLALVAATPRPLRELAADEQLHVPRLEDVRGLAADPRRELLVFGRSSSRTLRWLEAHVRCRVRFLAEERGLRASSPLAIGGAREGASASRGKRQRPPNSTLGMLLERTEPGALPAIVGQLADGAIVDTRVLMAGRFGLDESGWPSGEDRYASDLLRADGIADPWLRALTLAAADAPVPILFGAHTLVGPGLPVLLRGTQLSSRR